MLTKRQWQAPDIFGSFAQNEHYPLHSIRYNSALSTHEYIYKSFKNQKAQPIFAVDTLKMNREYSSHAWK